MNATRWTDDEIKYLRRYYPDKGPEYIAKKLNRSKNSVISKTSKLGITTKRFRKWQTWEENYIRNHYGDRKPESIAKTLKRSNMLY